MDKKTGSLLLIAFGVIFLLYNLNIVTFTPWSLIWPSLIIWLGLDQLSDSLKNHKESRNEGWEIILWFTITALGVYILLPKIGVNVPIMPWNIIWPTIIILLGFSMLFNKNKIVKVHLKGNENVSRNKEYRSSFIGEFNKGSTSWVLEDMKIHQSIGSINLDLTNAIIPDRDVTIEISGFIGDTNVYLPPDLAYHVEAALKVGEIKVFDHTESGTQRYINVKSADYDKATKKISLIIEWKIGDVNVRQIG